MSEQTPVPLLLELQGHAQSSDATQSIAVEPTGVLRISGVASGDSVAELNFGKYSLMVPLRVVAAVTCDDPGQHIAVDPTGSLRISGVASSAGLSPSVMRVSLEARLLELQLPRGATPKETFARLHEEAQQRLPPGTRVVLLNAGEASDGDVVFDVLKPAPLPARNWGE